VDGGVREVAAHGHGAGVLSVVMMRNGGGEGLARAHGGGFDVGLASGQEGVLHQAVPVARCEGECEEGAVPQVLGGWSGVK
jgi:hypothetical protein